MKETLFPWFQPIIEIASGRITGYEALARRRTPDGNVESAADVFSNPDYSAEQRLEVDRELRFQALQRFASEANTGGLSLNLSPEWIDQLENLDTLPTLEMIRKVGLDPSRIVLEITERDGCLDRIRDLAQAYRAAGARIAYDDFGSGFQQLDRLLAFTPDLLKLDLRMFHSGADPAQKRAVLQMIGQMGAQLGSKIVCEGVETTEDFFLALHCNASYVQGFLFAGAEPEFIEPDAMRDKVRALLEQHLDISVEETARRQWQNEGLHSNLLALRDLLRVEDSLAALENYHPARGMLRFFICNRQGQQISPNYRFEDGRWQGDDSVVGNNWSWRPYFYQLVGSADYDRRILRSSPYLDILTGQPCETLSLALDERRIMLVDVEASDRFGAVGTGHSDLMPALR
ncbi:MAG: EAL domain-containing protein [Oceanospirillaceae bacterium]|nr:EAL domain-containing protein [Oceanospirillaceae bacterium]